MITDNQNVQPGSSILQAKQRAKTAFEAFDKAYKARDPKWAALRRSYLKAAQAVASYRMWRKGEQS